MNIFIALPALMALLLLNTTAATHYFVIASLGLTAVILCSSLLLLRSAGRKDHKKSAHYSTQLPPEPEVFPDSGEKQPPISEKAS
ncbi:MAG TPA: hypothetical protein VGN15_13035 [Ktedonobacteraceae bacterium]|nr:hypothetical protein [Ktedonobacteraceae bacterium]